MSYVILASVFLPLFCSSGEKGRRSLGNYNPFMLTVPFGHMAMVDGGNVIIQGSYRDHNHWP